MTTYLDLDAIYSATSGSGFTAGGDLSGTSTSQTVIGIYGSAVANASPSSGQALLWNSGTSKWTPTSLSSGTFAAGGDLSGTDTSQVVIGLQSTAISATTPTAGQYLVLSGGAWTPTTLSLTLAGDVTGGYGANSVVKIRNTALAADISSVGASQDGYVLTWNNSSSEWQAIVSAGGAPSGAASGDLSGTYPGPTVSKINATQITTAGGGLSIGSVLRVTASNAADWGQLNLADTDAVTGVLPKGNQGDQDMAGDVTGSTAVSVVAKVNGSTVPAGGALTTGNVLQVSGAAALSYAALNLAGGADYVTGTLPKTNQANQDMVGDVSGTTGTAQVDKIKTKTLASALSSIGAVQDGYVLTWVNGSTEWQAKPAASSITFGGDLSGTDSSQTVEKINGTTVTSAGGALTTGAVLRVTGASSVDYGQLDLADTDAVTGLLPIANQVDQALGGDVSGTTATAVVEKVNGTTITTAGGALAVGAVLRTTAVGTADWGQLDLADTDAVTGVLPKANQGVQDMVGDVSGNTGAAVVDKLKGTALGASVATVGATQDGYVLTWDNGTSTWIPEPAASGFTAGGDLSGSSSSQQVEAFQSATTSINVGSATAPSTGQVLTATSSTTATWQTPGAFAPPITLTHVAKTTTYTITTSDYVILCDTSGGAWSLTLPTVTTGQSFIIKDSTGSFETNNLTLVRAGSEKIEGVAASRVLTANWGVYHVMNNGTDWFIL